MKFRHSLIRILEPEKNMLTLNCLCFGHSGTQVRLWSEEGPEAQVVGLDDNGFLQVCSKEEGMVSVEPDGNSFDMLKNLVVMKQH